MLFLSTVLAVPALLFSLSAVSIHVPSKRQVVSAHGTTVEPASDSSIAPGTSFPFSYEQANYCEAGYSPISVYLCSSPPTAVDVTTSGELTNGSFLFKFGDYLIPNFGMPRLRVFFSVDSCVHMSGLPQMNTPPPATLTMPDVDEADGTTLYFAVVETFEYCPVCEDSRFELLVSEPGVSSRTVTLSLALRLLRWFLRKKLIYDVAQCTLPSGQCS